MPMNNPISISELEKGVTRTYDVGIRYQGETREKRRINKEKVNEIVSFLQHQAFDKITADKVEKALELVRENPKWSGTHGAAKLAFQLKDRSNIGQASYLALLNACKGTFECEKKYEQFLRLLEEEPREALSWMVMGRSLILNGVLVVVSGVISIIAEI